MPTNFENKILQMMKRTFFVALLSTLWNCTGSDEQPQEPVAPTSEITGYPEDPDLAGQPADPAAPDAAGSDKEELPGTLTDDPFGAPPSGDSAAEESAPALETAPPPDEPAIPAPEGTDETYGDAFDDKPGYDPTLDDSMTAPAEIDAQGAKANVEKSGKGKSKGKSKGKGKGGSKITKGGKSGTRYVNALQLNVREAPKLSSPIVRRLLGGTKVTATIKGDWAQLSDGQWVRSKYLSAKTTKKVTDADVAKAWEKSRYKDTWQPKP